MDSLPQASVIIGFFDKEDIQLILHTVHSIVQNSPPQLLKEIILVDDFSHNGEQIDSIAVC